MYGPVLGYRRSWQTNFAVWNAQYLSTTRTIDMGGLILASIRPAEFLPTVHKSLLCNNAIPAQRPDRVAWESRVILVTIVTEPAFGPTEHVLPRLSPIRPLEPWASSRVYLKART